MNRIDLFQLELLGEELLVGLERLIDRGYSLVLVGGAVRDYLTFGHFENDFDFEIRGKDNKLRSLEKDLQSSFQENVEVLPFGVFRLKKNKNEFEFSIPRKERFLGELPYGHSDFEVSLNNELDYTQSFYRRDLTINSIGIEILKKDNSLGFSWVDPFKGLNDFRKREVNFCNDSFFYDPVRFLRLIRFHLNLNFNLSSDLEKQLYKFNLAKLTTFYFYKEFYKTKEKGYFVCLFDWVEKKSIELPIKLKALSFFKNYDLGNHIKDHRAFFFELLFLEISKKNMKDFLETVQLKKILIKRGEDLLSSYQFFKDKEIIEIKKELSLCFFNEGEVPRILRKLEAFDRTLNELDSAEQEILKKFFNKNIFDVIKLCNSLVTPQNIVFDCDKLWIRYKHYYSLVGKRQ